MTEFSPTLAEAKEIVAAAEAKAAEVGRPMCIAVVDAGGNPILQARMDAPAIGELDPERLLPRLGKLGQLARGHVESPGCESLAHCKVDRSEPCPACSPSPVAIP